MISGVSVADSLGCDGYPSRQWVTISGDSFAPESRVFLDDIEDSVAPFEIPSERLQYVSAQEIRACAGVGFAREWSARVVNGTLASNDFPFSVATRTVSIALSAAPATIERGGTSTLAWSSSGMSSCSASGGWSGSKAVSGSESVSPSGTTSYAITCSGLGETKSATATVMVNGGVFDPPAVGLAITPASAAQGKPFYIGWASENATGCTASGGWSGPRSLTGNDVLYPGSTTTYVLTCTGPGGSGTKSVTATVSNDIPGVQIEAAPVDIEVGSSSVLTWSSANVSDCEAIGVWSGTRPTGGSETVNPTNTATYTLQCSGEPVQSELISNGGFSNTVSQWTKTGSFFADSSVGNCNSCPGYAYLSHSDRTLQNSNNLYGSIWQEVNLPSDASNITLRYYVSVATLEPSAASSYDWLYVVLKDSSGNYLWQFRTFSNLNNGGWVSWSEDLIAWKGQRVRLEFWGTTDASNGTVFRIDDVSIQATTASRYSDTVTVNVRPPAPPRVMLSSTPPSIGRGQSAKLSWTAANSSTCTAFSLLSEWSGSRSTSGEQTVSPQSSTVFELSCNGPGGTSANTVFVEVVPPAPVVTLAASRSPINLNEATTITWSATDAVACTPYAAWGDEPDKAESGSQAVRPFRSTSYTLTCRGAGGTGAASVNVTVIQPALAAPIGLIATNSVGGVLVEWRGTEYAEYYEVERATKSVGPYSLIGTAFGSALIDTLAATGSGFLYRVRAVGYEGARSPYSNVDYTVTIFFTDHPIVPRVTAVKAVHLNELQSAANSLGLCAGRQPVGFTGGSVGTTIAAVHMQEILNAINAARIAMGFSTLPRSFSRGATVSAADIEELRAFVK